MPQWVRWALRLLLLLGALWLAFELANVLIALAIALLLTATFAPLVAWLDARGWPHLVSVLACMVALLGLLAGFVAFLAPVIAEQAGEFLAALPLLSDRLAALEELWGGWRGQVPFLPRFSEMTDWVAAQATVGLQRTLGMTSQVLNTALHTVTVLLLTFFFLKDGRQLLGGLLQVLPAKQRREAPDLVARIGHRVGRYMLGKLVVMACVGVLTTLGLWLAGMPYAFLLGMLAGLLDIIPYLGPIIAAVPGIALAATTDWSTLLWVSLVYLAVQNLESYVLTPWIVGRSVGLHPAWVLLALMVGAELMGVTGMVLAIPAAAALQVLVQELVMGRREPDAPEG